MDPVNEADLDWADVDREDARFRRKQLGSAAGGAQLGCSLYELPPGGRSWPYHYHAANEEALYVLAGEGRLRAADGEHELSAGDYVAFPADPDGGHRVVNDGDDVLRYLVVSTMREPDVTVYPDRDRIGVFAGSAPGSDEPRTVHGYFDLDDEVGYWED